jgi:RNA polymerase subunit RPABC4/transcription elongation factor Spt4
LVDKDQKFCPSCGSPMSGKKICSKCGTELEPTQKFCGNCGNKME